MKKLNSALNDPDLLNLPKLRRQSAQHVNNQNNDEDDEGDDAAEKENHKNDKLHTKLNQNFSQKSTRKITRTTQEKKKDNLVTPQNQLTTSESQFNDSIDTTAINDSNSYPENDDYAYDSAYRPKTGRPKTGRPKTGRPKTRGPYLKSKLANPEYDDYVYESDNEMGRPKKVRPKTKGPYLKKENTEEAARSKSKTKTNSKSSIKYKLANPENDDYVYESDNEIGRPKKGSPKTRGAYLKRKNTDEPARSKSKTRTNSKSTIESKLAKQLKPRSKASGHKSSSTPTHIDRPARRRKSSASFDNGEEVDRLIEQDMKDYEEVQSKKLAHKLANTSTSVFQSEQNDESDGDEDKDRESDENHDDEKVIPSKRPRRRVNYMQSFSDSDDNDNDKDNDNDNDNEAIYEDEGQEEMEEQVKPKIKKIKKSVDDGKPKSNLKANTNPEETIKSNMTSSALQRQPKARVAKPLLSLKSIISLPSKNQSRNHETAVPLSKRRINEKQKAYSIEVQRLITDSMRDHRMKINTLDVLKQLIVDYKPKTLKNRYINTAATHDEFKAHLLHQVNHIADIHSSINDISSDITSIQKRKNEFRKKIYELKNNHADVGNELNDLRTKYNETNSNFEASIGIINLFNQVKKSIAQKSNDDTINDTTETEESRQNLHFDYEIDESLASLSKVIDPHSGIYKKISLINDKLSKIDYELS